MKTRYLITLSIILIFFGCLFTYKNINHSSTNSATVVDNIVAPTNEYFTEEANISGKPVRIQIPSLNIDLTVIDGNYHSETNSWDLSKDKAQFATLTALANNKQGNTFIYGHNNRKVFSGLLKISSGDLAIITTDNGHRFVYEYYSLQVTKPENISVLKYEGPPILTLQTCSGAWYQNRSLFAFNLVEVI